MSLISNYELELEKFIKAKQSLNEGQNLQKRLWLKQSDRKSKVTDQILTIKDLLDQTVLEILLTRDAIQASFSESNPTYQDLLKLTALDERCKNLASSSEWSDRVSCLRASFKPEINEKFWWWFPEGLSKPTGFKQRRDWFLKFITNTIWVVALAILINISSRIIAGVPDLLGTGAVLLNAFLSVLVGKGILTGTNGWIEQQMFSLNIAKKHEKCVQLVLAIVILVLSITVHKDLHTISAIYFNKAESLYIYNQEDRESRIQDQEPNAARQQPEEEHFFTKIAIPQQGLNSFPTQIYKKLIGDQSQNAQADYYRATKLDPTNWKAHNRLGEIYEDQEDLAQATASYQLAAKGNLATSLINLSRCYILQNNSEKSLKPYLTAIGLLKKADFLIDHEKKRLKQNKLVEDPQWEPEIVLDEYNRRFHEAWAYLKLAKISVTSEEKRINLDFSMKMLDRAINMFEENKEHVDPSVVSKKSAHCIRAEVMDTYQDGNQAPPERYEIKDSVDDWRKCNETIALIQGVLRPYEAGWWTQANKRLSSRI